MKGDQVVRMTPDKDGQANHGHSCVKGRFAWGYATHRDRVLKPMIRDNIDEPWREVELGRSHSVHARALQGDPGRIRPQVDRRHHVITLHQRRSVRRTKARACRHGQQQRRYLCARVPFADRLRPETDARHVGRHAAVRQRDGCRRHHGHRRQPDRRPPGVRLADEAPPAPGRKLIVLDPRRSGWSSRRISKPIITCRCCRAPTFR